MIIDIEFERECGKCYGTSTWMPDKSCEVCKGKGKVATELGEALLEFLERHGIKSATKEQS